MLLVKYRANTGNNEPSWGDDILPVVATTSDIYFVYDKRFSYPQYYQKQNLEIVDGELPVDWVTRAGEQDALSSFNEWADDPYFYGYLVDNYDQKKTEASRKILNRYVDSQLDKYAVEKFGSIEAAKEAVMALYINDEEDKHKNLGWEKVDYTNKDITLTFDNIYRASLHQT